MWSSEQHTGKEDRQIQSQDLCIWFWIVHGAILPLEKEYLVAEHYLPPQESLCTAFTAFGFTEA